MSSFANCCIPSSIAAAEMLFRDLRQRPPDCEAALRSAFRCLSPKESLSTAALAAGLVIVGELERLAANGGDHPYHNRHHFAEAMLAMGWLCALAVEDGRITERQAVLGVVAMAGHDIGHDGTRCLDGTLEERSAEMIGTIAAGTGLDTTSCTFVRDLILASTPEELPPSRRPIQASPASAEMGRTTIRKLAREADVFASLLPSLGWQLSFALRREWRAAADPAAEQVVSFATRRGFLNAYRDHSAAAGRLGLSAATARQLCAFRVVAAELEGSGSASLGAVGLDRLPVARAARIYRAAWRRSRPVNVCLPESIGSMQACGGLFLLG